VRRPGVALGALATLGLAAAASPLGDPVSPADLPGMAGDDVGPAFDAFKRSCLARSNHVAALRAAVAPPPGLAEACAAANRLPRSSKAAGRFFARHFSAHRIPAQGFFTGYYEPVVAASITKTAAFTTPLYAAPRDLVTIVPGSVPGLDPVLNAARRRSDGTLVALPDRTAIEAGALGPDATPIAYVANLLEAFFIQVQGSARLRLPGGRLKRLVYAGRNGYPYTSIGKILVARLGVPPSEMGMAQLRSWISAHGQGRQDEGTKLMQQNRSFIFFRFDDSLPEGMGPVGSEGVSLTPMRSLAIDRTQWPYGLPFWIDTKLPDGSPFRRLMVGQDTGAAILGSARADVFCGTGDAAAARAGAMRQSGDLYVLWPKPVEQRRP
jgi:Membrane-bound lytic murein transglycosylase